MKEFPRKILGLLFVLIMCVSCYLTIVQIVNAYEPSDLIESISLRSFRDSAATSVFSLGDTLMFEVESKKACAYDLQFYENSSVVFDLEGKIRERVLVSVPVSSSVFDAGNVYVAYFSVFAFNEPVLGACFADYRVFAFEVVGIGTKLSLNVECDNLLGSMSLDANLTDDNGSCVSNETVDFSVRPCNVEDATYGWVAIGSAITSVDGVADLDIAFGWPDGNYSVRAWHRGNGNFGESRKIVDVAIVVDETRRNLNFDVERDELGSEWSLCSEGANGNLTIVPSNYSPYALLPTNISAMYSVDSVLDCWFVALMFFLDYVNETGCVSGVMLSPVEEENHVYAGCLVPWSPEVVGVHKVFVGFVIGNELRDFLDAIKGIGLVCTESVDLNIQSCPSRLVLRHPEAVYGDMLSLTIGFCKPRPLESDSTAFYFTTSLAPKFTYEGAEFAFDEGVGSIPIKLCVNGSLKPVNPTDVDGLVVVSLSLNFSGWRVALNVTASVDDSVSLYERKSVGEVVTFSRVNVQGVGGDGDFKFNYTVRHYGDEYNRTYVGAENTVEAEASLFGLPLWNAPVSFVAAKNTTRLKTSYAFAVVPSGSRYLCVLKVYETLEPSQRVKIRFSTGEEVYADANWLARVPANAQNLTVLEDPLIGDANSDGIVELRDVLKINAAMFTKPGDPKWDPRNDVNNDGVVDLTDVLITISHFLDTVKLDADLEFFGVSFSEVCSTNELGLASGVWVPSQTGKYVVDVKLPSSFGTAVACLSNVTQVNASLGIMGCFDVIKRPIDMSVSYLPDEPTLDDEVTLIANVFDLALGEPAKNLPVCFYAHNLTGGDDIPIDESVSNSSGFATILWNPKSFYAQYGLWPYFVLCALCAESNCTQMSEVKRIPIDTRYPTSLEFLGDEVMNADVGKSYELCFRLTDRNGSILPNRTVYIYYMNETTMPYQLTNATGIAHRDWPCQNAGVYWFRAIYSEGYHGWYYKNSNEVKIVAVAAITPTSVLFDVQPREFKPGSSITLWAKVLNASSNDPLEGYTVTFYQVEANNNSWTLGTSPPTNKDGITTFPCIYPPSGAYAFKAIVNSGQPVIASPVMLTVSKKTALKLNVTRDQSSFDCVVSGVLLSEDEVGGLEPASGKLVKIYVNDTLEANLTTADWYGNFSLTLNLPSLDNKATSYEVRAVFEGDNPSSASAYAKTPNSTEYAVCTTIQYGCKPAANSTWLTVEPQSTLATTQTKTPEELEAEAKAEGLTIWHEFSWWYPWYRLHIRIDINPTIDIGFNPILPGGETANWTDIEFFNSLTEEIFQELLMEAFGLIGTYLLARYTSIPFPWIGFGAELAKIGFQAGVFLADWNSAPRLLAAGLMSIAMSLYAVTSYYVQTSFFAKFVDALWKVCGSVQGSLRWMMVKFTEMAEFAKAISRSWMDVIEAVADASIGIIALCRYGDLIS